MGYEWFANILLRLSVSYRMRCIPLTMFLYTLNFSIGIIQEFKVDYHALGELKKAL